MAHLTFIWPLGYQDFATPALPGTFTLNDAPLHLATNSTAAPGWPLHDWLGSLGFQAAGDIGGGPSSLLLRSMMGFGV